MDKSGHAKFLNNETITIGIEKFYVFYTEENTESDQYCKQMNLVNKRDQPPPSAYESKFLLFHNSIIRFIADSGATEHLINDESKMTNIVRLENPRCLGGSANRSESAVLSIY